MSLTCDHDADYGDYSWFYFTPDDFTQLATKRGRRCSSCGSLIKVGETVLSHQCFRHPQSDIEERIHGDEVPMATKHLCESCGDLAMNLRDLGYCVSPDDDVRELVKEYAEMTQQERKAA